MIWLDNIVFQKGGKGKCILFFFCLLMFVTASASSYVELIRSDKYCTVWWSGSTYKVMKDTPLPEKKGEIVVRAAKNETESFQVVLHPLTDLKNITIAVSDFGSDVFTDDTQYTKNSRFLMEYRKKMGDLLEQFYKLQ
jgi:hypothetical protein